MATDLPKEVSPPSCGMNRRAARRVLPFRPDCNARGAEFFQGVGQTDGGRIPCSGNTAIRMDKHDHRKARMETRYSTAPGPGIPRRHAGRSHGGPSFPPLRLTPPKRILPLPPQQIPGNAGGRSAPARQPGGAAARRAISPDRPDNSRNRCFSWLRPACAASPEKSSRC